MNSQNENSLNLSNVLLHVCTCIVTKMVLHGYFQTIDRLSLATLSICGPFFLFEAGSRTSQLGVSCVWSQSNGFSDKSRARVNYDEYTPKVNARVGRYTAENRLTRAAYRQN